MSETQAVVASVEQSSVPVATPAVVPGQKMNAIQLIEQELVGFIKQREQSIANVHAVEGAIQAAQHLLAKLRVEAAKGEAKVEQVVKVVQAEAGEVAATVETESAKVVELAKEIL